MICDKCGIEMIKNKNNEIERCPKCGSVVSPCPEHLLLTRKAECGYRANQFIAIKNQKEKIKPVLIKLSEVAAEVGKSSVYVRNIAYEHQILIPPGRGVKILLTEDQRVRLVALAKSLECR
jgi:hypothetical protein